MFPRVFYSAGTPKSLDVRRPKETCFVIIMDDLSKSYSQTPMMSKKQAELVLGSLALFHAHFWGMSPTEERGGFWVHQKRLKYQEVQNSEETWSDFLQRFPELEPSVANSRCIGALI